jgi:hypothetical protein
MGIVLDCNQPPIAHEASKFVTPVTTHLDFLPSPVLCSYLIIMDNKKHSFVNKVKNMIKPMTSLGFFKKAKHFTITGGTFTEVLGDVGPEFVHFFFSSPEQPFHSKSSITIHLQASPCFSP